MNKLIADLTFVTIVVECLYAKLRLNGTYKKMTDVAILHFYSCVSHKKKKTQSSRHEKYFKLFDTKKKKNKKNLDLLNNLE